MYQQEIKFFWPLTEQIPLDLDYTDCYRRITQSVAINGGTSITMSQPPVTWTTTIMSDEMETKKLSIKSDEMETKKLSIVLDKKPNFMLRWLYKLLKINWKI